MTARQQTSRLFHEVQQSIASYQPKRPGIDREQLASFAKAVLASVDVRDLRGLSSAQLIERLEDLLAGIAQRGRDQIKVDLNYDEASDTLVVTSCLEDQPFLVSTMRAALASEHLDVRRFLNAIVRVRRDPVGRLGEVGSGTAESVMRIEVGLSGGSAGRDGGGVPMGLQQRIETRLKLAQAMVSDFPAMKGKVKQVADGYFAAAQDRSGEEAANLREAESLLRWLCDENSVLLAVEEYDVHGEPTGVLGTSRVSRPQRDRGVVTLAARGEGRRVRYQRSAEESPVHRAGKPGHFIVTRFGEDGRPAGALVIDVLFTYKALHTPPDQIPVIHAVLRELIVDRQVSVDSDRGKNITNAFNSLPLEYLLSEDRDSIWELTDRILRAEAEGGSDVHIRVGENGRFAFVFVALPRWQFSEELRLQVQNVVLESLGGTYADYGVYIDRYDNAVIHFYVTGVGSLQAVDTEDLRGKVLALARSWTERLREALAEVAEGPRVEELFDLYEHAFTDEHMRRCGVARLTGDIRCLEALRAGAETDCDLYVSEFSEHPGSLNLRIFSRHGLNLSRELPVLSHFGFEVVDEYSRDVTLPGMPTVDMDNFRFDVRDDRIGQIMARRSNITTALREVFAGRSGDDDLNRLVVVSDMTSHEVEILRAFVAYLHQLALPFSDDLVRQTLVEHPSVAEALIDWLAARFDPKSASEAQAAESEAALEEDLREVTDYTADRVLQAVAEVVRATRRTNAWVADVAGGQPLAFKISSGELSFGPEPKPMREIWVYHREFEGVHLRGGRVARGGLRFSDRPDDFRTEIHGLMSTQMVKNVVIVPMGAKGGFVLRNPPSGRDELRAAGDATYEKFVTALLSVTDNLVDGQAVTPKGILLYKEGTDPYLVVAADKGTAHMSDTANRVSAAHGFWLDDAFASGGSAGYDHKATGITARGAWEATKRCFREMGVDPERDVITCIGVGDMSGDVFGNGLLRSRTIKLLAAFNHAHIFIDPNPEPERSFLERKRLFEKPRSQWSDYDTAMISQGGGVYPRKSKLVELSPEARAMLGIAPGRRVNGEDVMRAIMRMQVDLCWMGGIGTYVKSKDETHAEVGDKANDGARVDASELRCKVFAEGANLAITDRGRVEFARGGGHNYNAFLDNSGGVDTSDHEVNIKILFSPLLRTGAVSREKRNDVLRQCEDEVVEMVLDNNRSQSRMVSYDVRRSRQDVFRYSRALGYLARQLPFNPDKFALPSEEELGNRNRKGQGLFKCEAAVLCAHAKMLAYRQLLETDPLPDGFVVAAVRKYFPRAMQELAGDQAVAKHLLRREIATTVIVNDLVDNAGGSMLAEVISASGRSTRDVVLAYLQASAAADVAAIRSEVFALEDERRQEAVYSAMGLAETALEDAAFYLIDQKELPPLDDAQIAQTRELLANIEQALPAGSKGRTASRLKKLEDAGVPRPLAERIVKLRYLTPVLDAVRMAAILRREPKDLLYLRLQVTDAVNFFYLNQALDRMVYAAPWDGPAVSALRRQLNFHLHKLVRMVKGDDVAGMIEAYGLADFCAQVLAHADSGPTISGLVMLDDWLRRLLPPLTAIK
ncbi:MAG TPA: NAD-glutamate dehydrogenase domain-containing protein [Nannocystaceae bacterium]|nr:NAD-glutamate dehydrogenase domain-containing protein [Nannocystaceae bacterium]